MGLPAPVTISCKGLLVGSRNWWKLGKELELSEICVLLSFYALASSHFLLLCTEWEMSPATAPALEPVPIGGAIHGDCGSLQVYVVGPCGRKYVIGGGLWGIELLGDTYIFAPVSFLFFNLNPFVMTHTWGKTEGKRERNRGKREGERRKKRGNPV